MQSLGESAGLQLIEQSQEEIRSENISLSDKLNYKQTDRQKGLSL